MKKNIVSQRLSVHQQHELLLVLEKAGLSDHLAQAVIQSPDNALAERIVRIVQESSTIFKTLTVLVDYQKSVFELVEAVKYSWIDPEFNLPLYSLKGPNSGKRAVLVRLLRFGRLIATDVVLGEMREMGFRPVTIKELLALGSLSQIATPQMSGIVGLGTTFLPETGMREKLVATIYLCRGKPELRLMGAYEGMWGKDWFFAAVEVK